MLRILCGLCVFLSLNIWAQTTLDVLENQDVDVTEDGVANNDVGVRHLSGSPPTGFIRINGAGSASSGDNFANTDCVDALAAVYTFTTFPPNAYLPSEGDVTLVKDGSRYGKFVVNTITPNVGINITYVSLGACGGSPPVSSFTSSSYDLIGFFTDTSTNSPTSWNWDFDGLGTSGVQNPAFYFGTANTFTVSLMANNASGMGNTFMDNITVSQEPSTTRNVGQAFDFDGDTTNDLNVIAPDGCGGNATLQMTGGATYADISGQDYRTVTMGDVPGMITGSGNFCGTEGANGLFNGIFVRSSNGSTYKVWFPEITNSSVRAIFEVLIMVPVELQYFEVE